MEISPEQFKTLKGQARGHVVGSFIYFTLGGAFDEQAIETGNALIKAKPSGPALMKGDVRRAVTLAKEAGKALPEHVRLSAQWIKAVTDYMKTNNIPIPGQDEIERVAKRELRAEPQQIKALRR